MRRTSIYVVFSISIIVIFGLFVQQLDDDAVHKLETTFNQQQSMQVNLASRSIEEQFGWQIDNIQRVADELSSVAQYIHFYDSSGRRLLYRAQHAEQASFDNLELHLTDLIDSFPQDDVRMWGIIDDSQQRFFPTISADLQNTDYQTILFDWYTTYRNDIEQVGDLFVAPVYATPDEQYIGMFHRIRNYRGDNVIFVSVLIDLKPLLQQFVAPIRSGEFGAAWMQDFQGQVVFDHESEIIGTSVYDLHANYPNVLALDKRYPVELSGMDEYTFTIQRGSDIRRKLVAWDTVNFGNQSITLALSAPDTEISAWLSGSRQISLFLAVILTTLLMVSGGLFYHFQQTELRRLVKERTLELEQEHQQLQQEIAERERAEVALRASEMNFRQLAENIREVYFLFDTTANEIVYVSPSYHDIWQSDIDLLHKTPFALIPTIHPDDRHIAREQIKTFLTAPEVSSTEFRIIRGDGIMRWLRWRAFPIITTDTIDRVICTAEDITAQKQARDAEISIELERKRTQLLSTFVQDAFHEFRTPLSIINTSVYLLDNVDDEAKRQDYLQFIRAESTNIIHLVEQLVTMARLDVDEPFRMDHIHLDTMMSDLKIMMEPDVQGAGLQSVWELDAQLRYIEGDQEQLHRAIKNIIVNAIKYSNTGDTITIRTSTDDHFATIEIRDQGEGIDPDQLEHIFERFYRIDKAHSTRGFGLGLPIAQRIIERHGGAIQVDSTTGNGSTFRILLPLIKQPATDLQEV